MTKTYLSAIALLMCFCGAVNAQPRPGQTPIDWAKGKCVEIGFTAGTEKFGGCVLQLSKDAPGVQATGPVAVAETKLAVLKDCTDCPEMLVIPGGSFEMGSYDDADSRPVHRVNIAGFLLGKTEVTQGQWRSMMGGNPSYFGSCGDDCPVERVSWDEAQEFAQRLSQKTGKQYRLPSEAEWEYAARAGSSSKWSFGDVAYQLGDHGWYAENSQNLTQRVAQKRANAFGLFDMHGNVWEWVQDCWHANYTGAPTNGGGNLRVLRGGSWGSNPADLRSAFRHWLTPDFRLNYFGLRLARTLLSP